jgi:photosystem II stability/assembly factor-like uncharacterized protein
VWVSGQGATWTRTTDGGRNWTAGVVPGDTALEFRDVHAQSAREAWLLAAGPGDRSRIYHTTSGGTTWQLQWTNDEPAGFYDCFDFWDEKRGAVYGDAVGGSLRVLTTNDGGRTWRRVANDRLPPALPGEGGFAASGTCITAGPDGRAWIATGNGPRSRVLTTLDYGESWSAVETPVAAAEGAGLTSVSMVDERTGTVFGGSLAVTDAHADGVARTTDGGRTWKMLPQVAMLGAVFGGVHVPDSDGNALVAVGPGGLDVTMDGGLTWRTADLRAWWGVGTDGPDAIWVAGPNGRIARIRLK